MLSSYLKTALRSLLRNKGYTAINVTGLAVGIACCLLILLFVRHELSFDRYHVDADRTVRVTRSWFDNDGTTTLHLARVAAPIGPLLESSLPEVQEAVRAWGGEFTVSVEKERFTDDLYFVEPGFIDMFSVRFIEGDPSTALETPYAVVLTASTARTYFGGEEALGRLVHIDGEAYTVTGTIADPPANTHFPFDVLGSFATLEAAFPPETWSNWGWNNYATYLRLVEGASPSAIEAKLPVLLDDHYKQEASAETRLHLQPLTDIHLRSQLDAELAPTGDIRYVWLFSAVAFFLMLIACFNFVNLTTARGARRAREVGMRKALGADRGQIIRQFLGEALLLVFAAVIAAVALAGLALPVFNTLAGTSLVLFGGHAVFTVASLIGVFVVVSLAAGSYPAFFLSGFEPATVLKGAAPRGQSRFRTGLVVGQFSVAIVLLVGMGVVYLQLEYVQSKRLGFVPERLIVMSTTPEMRQDLEPLTDRLVGHPNILSAAGSQRVPSDPLLDTIDGAAEVDGEMKPFQDLPSVAVTPGFTETYGMALAAGRAFSSERATDSTEAFMLNEAAVRALGWDTADEAVGQVFVVEGNSSGFYRRGSVIGVVEDFHFESLHQRISPLIFMVYPEYVWQMTVRVAGRDIDETLAFLKSQWAPYQPNETFEYSFVDAEFGALYDSERRLGQIFGVFAGLAILIACLGLFGLASYITEQRTKEIGVRKVLGASVGSVVVLLTRDFAKLVAFALVVATPIAVVAMQKWLDSFAYHPPLPWWLIAAAGALTLAVALLTVSVQTLRAALVDPADSLRYE